MPYEIKFTDYQNKLAIVVEDNSINDETTLKLPGRNTISYGSIIAENFLHLLENFADVTPPARPVEGQTWYDTDVEQLKIYNGVNWIPANAVNKTLEKPTGAVEGDLWIDRENLQLYMYTVASGWVLIGPEFSEGLVTGTIPKAILASDNNTYNLLQIDVNSVPVALIANKEFTPKQKIDGFLTVKPGINLSSKVLVGQEPLKFRGIAEKAENLIISGNTIPSGNFLRSDIVNQTNFAFNIANNEGINLGINNEFTVAVEGTNSVIKNNVSGSAIDIKTRLGGLFSTVVTIDANKKVGINKSNPDTELEVVGDVKITVPVSDGTKGRLIVTNTTDSNKFADSGAIISYGGLGVSASTTIGTNLYMINAENGYIEANKLVPLRDADEVGGTQSYIGTENLRFNSIYAKRFYGDFEGNVTGSVTGRSGSANRLAKSSAFSFIGDVEIDAESNNNESSVSFTGTGEGVVFPVTVSKDFIAGKEEVITTQGDDELLLGRVREDIGIKKITVNNLLSSVPIMPIGTIVPFAGLKAPSSWLFCNGQQVRITDFLNLFNTIGFTYLSSDLVTPGFFAVPDLRGRFALGLQNMGDLTPSDIRVADPIANEIGKNSGTETKTLTFENLPDHEHDLTYLDHPFYATNEQQFSVQNINVDEISYYAQVGDKTGYGVKNTAGIKNDINGPLNTPFDVMNPYLVLNYIIYAG